MSTSQERDEPSLARFGASTTRWHGHRSSCSATRRSAPPYFQSISLGLESAFFLAGHIANRNLSVGEMFDRYESFMYRQWLRVYMRTQTIHHNKDLLQSVGDDFGLLAKLHVY